MYIGVKDKVQKVSRNVLKRPNIQDVHKRCRKRSKTFKKRSKTLRRHGTEIRTLQLKTLNKVKNVKVVKLLSHITSSTKMNFLAFLTPKWPQPTPTKWVKFYGHLNIVKIA